MSNAVLTKIKSQTPVTVIVHGGSRLGYLITKTLIEQGSHVIIIDKFNGGPVGIGAMAAAANEERETIEEVYEPYLMRIGFIERTPKGRVVTGAAYKHLNLYNQDNKQEKLI